MDGPSLAETLPRLCQESTSIDIAMAYVKISGLRTLIKSAKSFLESNGLLRIVFGLSTRYGITDKESAQLLLDISGKRNVTVKKWNSCGFHPKLLIFYGQRPSIVVGSANLTAAAQSTNAEANILIEDPEPQVLKDAQRFFSHYFDTAPLLRQIDVEKYSKKESYKSESILYGSNYEDELPSPLIRKRELSNLLPNKIWKIAPGADAECWDEWVKAIDEDGKGIVAMGWNEVGSLDDFETKDALKIAVKETAEDIWNKEWTHRPNVAYVTDQLWDFRNGISKNDVFIVYSETRVLGIAKVEEKPEYVFADSGNFSFYHQIKVKYMWYKEWPRRADQKIIDTLGKQGTLRLFDVDWLWSYLLKTLP